MTGVKSAKGPSHVVEVTTSNPEAVQRILSKIQAYGAPGHCFPIHGDKEYLLGYWDGDGNDRIYDIQVRSVVARYRAL